MQPIIDEVLRDPEPRIALHVVDEILLPVAVVQHLDHKIEPSPFVRHHPRHPRVILGLDHIEDRQHVRRENRLARIKDSHLLGQVDGAPDRAEMKAERVDRPRLRLLVPPPLAHRGRRIRERVIDGHEQRLPRFWAQGAPLGLRGGDDGRDRHESGRLHDHVPSLP